MKIKTIWFILSLCTLLLLPQTAVMAAKPITPAVPNTGTISGTITKNSQPLNCQIFIPGKSFMAKTNNTGSYILYYVPVGQQNVMIEVPGILPFSVGDCNLTTLGCTVSKNILCLPGELQTCADCPSVKETCTSEGAWPGCNCTGICASDPRYGLSCDGPDLDLCRTGLWGCAPDGSLSCIGDQPRQEVCDGIDNDCNGIVDDGDLCPSGLVCAGVNGCVQP
jgi:hypothetical protein